MSSRFACRPLQIFGAFLTVALLVAGCTSAASHKTPGPTFDASGFKLTSPAFSEGGDIPVKYTCLGGSLSIPVTWEGAPPETRSMALIMEDYSAQVTHWVVYNLPGATSGSLPDNYTRSKDAAPQAVTYLGPCPGNGNRNNYHLALYALSAPLKLKNATTLYEVENAMGDKVIASATLSGWYAM